ncbi:MAG TPA: sulfatase-like hydrolase/transferase [Myxococcota bacterium]|nr:sulfatase-like hydrolase/transferase [Myxococcota bacterium]
MAGNRGASAFANYLLLSYAALALHVTGFARDAGADVFAIVFAGAVSLTYAAVYLAPVAALAGIVHWLCARRGAVLRAIGVGFSVVSVAALEILVFSDRFLFRLYGFHLNGFVWNLVTTRGGIESLDSGADTFAVLAGIAALFVTLQAGLWWAAGRESVERWLAPWRRGRALAMAAGLLAVLGVGERALYAFSYAVHRNSVLEVANSFPYYLPTRARTVTRALGIESPDHAVALEASRHVIDYPLRPLQRVPHKSYNIVWLVSESLRADALDPEIMPATSEFAKRAIRFHQHYSGGNNTRMGMFSMFYGLYGGYWFAFQEQERSPVLMDTLIDDGYRMQLRTSAKFSYPEFDETLFVRVPRAQMHEGDGRPGWQCDRENVAGLLDFIDHRDPAHPFFAFMFFESPHARYEFPQESVIRTPYLDRLNYATMDLRRDIGLIKNRYLNAVHHLDSQLARVFADLEQQGLLDSTIVVVTGDHGEEFMEKGRWGHASAFSEEQTRVPLLLYVPGEPPRDVERMTSHLDLPATILRLLGVSNPPSDYSLGYDLLNGPGRSFTVVSGWDDLAYVDVDHKIVLPIGRIELSRRKVTSRDDGELPPRQPNLAEEDHSRVLDLLRDLTRFGRQRG